jgi:hypothetical protein
MQSSSQFSLLLRALRQQMKRLAKKIERERTVLSAMSELSVQIVAADAW